VPPRIAASPNPAPAQTRSNAISRRLARGDVESAFKKAPSGRREKKAADVATASGRPPALGATISPKANGSKARDHEPCSFGRKTGLVGSARAEAGVTARGDAVTGRPYDLGSSRAR
jgi:hypothetical protein